MRQHDQTDLLNGRLLIGDRWLDEASGGTQDHVNPSTGKPQQTVVLAGPREVEQAVAAARQAFPAWRSWSTVDRRKVLWQIAQMFRDHAEEFVTIAALETGTPVGFTRPSMESRALWFEYFAGWIDKLEGATIPVDPGRTLDFTLLEPVGVVAKILTWNTPLAGLAMGVAPALAAGCCVVIKPSELAPFACARFGELCLEAGLPPGVISVVPGGPEAGQALVQHPDVDKISFTGGLATAQRIQAAAAESLTPLVFELGGKSANIVFGDADLDRALDFSKMITALSGQGCSLPSRLLVQDTVYDDVVDRIVDLLRSVVVVGDPFEEQTTMGPVITSGSCERILGMVERAKATSARVLLGGERAGGSLSDGYFIPPTVLADVELGSEMAQDEVFGPVLSILKFSDEAQAVEVANDTRFGLAGYIHTQDIGRALRVASSLDAGTIGINGHGAPAGYNAPFGGVKDSGYGREGGRDGIMEFVRTKNVAIDIH
jgi:aldehyde dehydrogenase (NAD+)